MAYGYPGDATPDSNSLAGVGDRDNPLSATSDHQSVALTLEGRKMRFGVWGQSTGQPFVENGKTYYDDDTAPTTFAYQGEQHYNPPSLVDVYDPKHPPDRLSLRSAYENRQDDWAKSPDYLRTSQETRAIVDSGRDLTGAEEAEEEAERKKEEEPYGAKIFAPKYIVQNYRQRWIDQLGNDPYKDISDEVLYKSLKQKFPSSLDLYKEANPVYAKVDKADLGKAIKKKYFPDISEDEFNDRFNPDLSPVTNLWHKITEEAANIIPGFYDSLANIVKFPENVAKDFGDVLQKLGMTKEAAADIQHSLMTGITTRPDQLHDFAGKLLANAEQYKKEHPIAPPQGIVGQTAEKAFFGLGHAPEALIEFMPGPRVASLAIGMFYDAVQGDAKAREKGLDNHLMFGAEGLSYRSLQELFLRTVRGRGLSALVWGLGGVSDQAAQDFLAGKRSTLSDYFSTAALNAGLGAWLSTGKLERPAEVKEILRLRERGEYDRAGHQFDRLMLLGDETTRKAVTNNLLAWRNEAIEAGPKDAPL